MLTAARWLLIPAVLALGLLAPGTVQAVAPEVSDSAGFFKPDAVKRANRVVEDIWREYKKDLLIETVQAAPAEVAAGLKKAGEDKQARNRVFDEWARDRARDRKVNGVYILISRDPEHLQIEVGNETAKKAFTLEDRNHLAQLMLQEFRGKHYDEGLLKGVNFVQERMKSHLGKQPAERQPAHAAPAAKAWDWKGLLCVGLVVGLGIWLVIALVRALSGGGGYGYGGGGYGGGWGGGFFPSLLGGLFGAAAGMWMYNNFFGGGASAFGSDATSTPDAGAGADQPADTDYSGTGGDFGDDAGGGGGDFGGDAGGGDFGSGGDFGGGDFGGGDFGGGGDF